jgi:hypothetical protein
MRRLEICVSEALLGGVAGDGRRREERGRERGRTLMPEFLGVVACAHDGEIG